VQSPNWYPILVRALTQTLDEIFNGGFYADKVLNRVLRQNRRFGSKDRKFLAETVYDMVRWWELLAAIDHTKKTTAALNAFDFARRWVIYEAWKNKLDASAFIAENMEDFDQDIPSFNETSGWINNFKPTEAQKHSFPDWLYQKFLGDYGMTEVGGLLESLNRPAKVFLRANTLKTNPDELKKKLIDEGFLPERAIQNGDGEKNEALVMPDRKNVFITKCFTQGLFEVQDLASQKIAPLLNVKPGERIADVCAGAGGKTLHLASLMKNKGSLLAGDVSEKKLAELKIRAARNGVSNLRIQTFENSKDLKRHAGNFDGVLIDAPCSGTGVIRRNPDTKWKLSLEELERLKNLQVKVLDDYSKFVKPGGRLVYATCSLLKEENEMQVEAFLIRHPEYKSKSSFKTRPDQTDEDGFFAEVFEKLL
jgi:16S rRNA (cytosine967-C5)-methyltransferase